ncbi:protein NDRG1-like [Halichondria panicea]|uniref:protein NDRG1-like n=1 Tax=Halichondria panicea TaxID=6063 RepID=UPI00312B76A1
MEEAADTAQVNFEIVDLYSLDRETALIDTPYGGVSVTLQGDKGDPAILTYHDIGLNHCSNFGTFLGSKSMEALADKFCWYHINAPGQEFGAEKLPVDFSYPTMTQLAEQIEYIMDYYQLAHFIGLGVGAGANVLARYAMLNPERVSGLILINLEPQAMSWTHPAWLSGKAVQWQLKGREIGIPRLAAIHLKHHAFGSISGALDGDLVRSYMEELSVQQPNNLALLMDSYHKRSSITGDFIKLMECPCLFVVSGSFTHKETLVKLCSLLPQGKATYLEISNTSGLLLEEQPARLAIALQLFLQGLGLVPALSTHHTCPSLHTSMVLEGISAPLYPIAAS